MTGEEWEYRHLPGDVSPDLRKLDLAYNQTLRSISVLRMILSIDVFTVPTNMFSDLTQLRFS